MTSNPTPTTKTSLPSIYQFKFEGHLDPQWADWFEDLSISLQSNGDTLLSGPVTDQAALYGLLRKARDLGLPLISVCRIEAQKT